MFFLWMYSVFSIYNESQVDIHLIMHQVLSKFTENYTAHTLLPIRSTTNHDTDKIKLHCISSIIQPCYGRKDAPCLVPTDRILSVTINTIVVNSRSLVVVCTVYEYCITSHGSREHGLTRDYEWSNTSRSCVITLRLPATSYLRKHNIRHLPQCCSIGV